MQQQNRTDTNFLPRTDALAEMMRCRVAEMPDKIGVSRRMFYGYRSGKYPVSRKVWEKLEALEAEVFGAPERSSSLREEVAPYGAARTSHRSALAPDTDRIRSLEDKVETLGRMVSQLVEMLTKKES